MLSELVERWRRRVHAMRMGAEANEEGYEAYFLERHASELEAALREADSDAEERLAEAYQVVGTLADYAGVFDHDDVIRALDRFSGSEIEGELLPWPREPLPGQRSGGWVRIEEIPEAWKDGRNIIGFNPVRGVFETAWNGENWVCGLWGPKFGHWYPEPTHARMIEPPPETP